MMKKVRVEACRYECRIEFEVVANAYDRTYEKGGSAIWFSVLPNGFGNQVPINSSR